MSKPKVAAPEAPDYASANREAIQTDIATLPLRRRIEAEARLGRGDFAGLGDAELSAQMFQQSLAQAPQAAQGLLDLQRAYGGDFAREARRQLEITDPEGFRLRQQFGDRLLNGRGSMEELVNQDLKIPTYEEIGNAPTLSDDPATMAARAQLQGQIYDDLSRVGMEDPAIRRAAEQAARARGAASGNILGDGAAIREALSVRLAQRDLDNERQQKAAGFMASGQSVGDRANALAQGNFSNTLQALGQRNQAKQNTFQAQQTGSALRQGARQQDLANIQSFLGLQPIVSQGGQLQGLQQGAAPFVNNGYAGANINANAGAQGAQFAQGIFGTQANIMNTQQQAASASSPLAILGQVSSIAGNFGSAYKNFCHVARMAYGDDNPQWVAFYLWKEAHAPAWFRKLYNRTSAIAAVLLRPFRPLVRRWMDTKLVKL